MNACSGHFHNAAGTVQYSGVGCGRCGRVGAFDSAANIFCVPTGFPLKEDYFNPYMVGLPQGGAIPIPVNDHGFLRRTVTGGCASVFPHWFHWSFNVPSLRIHFSIPIGFLKRGKEFS